MSETIKKNGSLKSLDELITNQDVDTVVKRALGPNIKLINYHAKIYSEEKVGFLGSHKHLIVIVERNGKKETETHSFFLKHIPYENQEQVSLIYESKVFYKETMFYKTIASELLSGIKDKSWCAQCYLVKDDLLIFEDLKIKNYSNKPKILDNDSLKAALTALANLHASSMIAEIRVGKSLKELQPLAYDEVLYVHKGRYKELIRTGVDVCVAIAKDLTLDSTKVPKVMNLIFDAMTASKTRKNVVCHGDAWSNNLMFKDSQPIPKCVLVDFQLVRYAPMMTDVAQLLYLTTRREFRDKNSKNLLAHYHNTLCEALRDSKEVIPPTFDEIVQDYEALSFTGLVTAALYFPIILVDPKYCVELTKDSEGFANLFFRDRVDLVMSFMKDPNFSDRMTEVIREMVERADEFLSVKL